MDGYSSLLWAYQYLFTKVHTVLNPAPTPLNKLKMDRVSGHLHMSRGVQICSTCVFPQNSGSFKPRASSSLCWFVFWNTPFPWQAVSSAWKPGHTCCWVGDPTCFVWCALILLGSNLKTYPRLYSMKWILKIYLDILCFAALGLFAVRGLSSSCGKGGYSLVALRGFLLQSAGL